MSETTLPKRVQRKRTKGYKLPPNTKCVNRPGPFGNPFTGPGAVEAFDKWLSGGTNEFAIGDGNLGMAFIPESDAPKIMRDRLKELRGINLACFCPLGKPCHADILLREANK